jgi:hypothetical protein
VTTKYSFIRIFKDNIKINITSAKYENMDGIKIV